MKSFIRYFQGLMLGILLTTTISCEDFALGEKFLQKPPSSDVTIDTIFSTAVYARRVLWNSYGYLPYSFWSSNSYNFSTSMWYGILENLTDLTNSSITWDGPNKAYYSGAYNAGSEESSDGFGGTKYGFTRRNSWQSIRMAWVFIENVDRVPDMDANEKLRLKAEAKVVIATQYIQMLRHFGGLPIVNRAISAEDGLGFPSRSTLHETVQFIVGLLDEAINCKELPWYVNEDESDNWSGRLTRASAMGLKVRLLLFVASPLFNSSTPYYEGEASTRLMTWYGNYDQKRWDDAMKAGEEFFAALKKESYYALVKDGEPRMAFRNAYYTRGTTESLISVRRHYKTANIGGIMQSSRWGAWGVTKEYFDMFPMADGTDFDWDNPEHIKNPFANRDPRLCETILIDGDRFGSGTAEIFRQYSKDKVNYPKGQHYNNKNVSLDDKGLTTNGLTARKFLLDRQGEWNGRVIQWPLLRLAEVFLSYAEALNECNRTDAAYEYINAVRNRVGLGNLKAGLSKEEFREAVIRERACEFGFEEIRFFDLIRWKREADFTKHLHGLYFYKHKNTGEYLFEFPQLKERAWQRAGGFSAKWYLSAFPPKEVNKGYGLVQNPGWE